jgi:AcrR family transcriptional regulator
MTKNDPRERILSAAMDTIAERGMAGLRMEDVGRRVSMSPGHLLYYYRSKRRLLLETLRWSEHRLAKQRAHELSGLAGAGGRLEHFVAIYLPTSSRHAEWLLWLQVWALVPEDPEAAEVTGALNELWADDLGAIVELGQASGEFARTDLRRFTTEFIAVLNGLSLHMLHSGPLLDRERAIQVAMQIARSLLGVGLARE